MTEVSTAAAALVRRARLSWGRERKWPATVHDEPEVRSLYAADPAERRAALLLLLDDPPPDRDLASWRDWRDLVVALLSSAALPLMAADVTRIFERVAKSGPSAFRWSVPVLTAVVEQAERAGQLDSGARRAVLVLASGFGEGRADRIDREVAALERATVAPDQLCLMSGELWADAVIADVGAMSGPQRAHWTALFDHAARASGGKPNPDWWRVAKSRAAVIDPDDFSARVAVWLPRVALHGAPGDRQPRGGRITAWLSRVILHGPRDDRSTVGPLNAAVLKGLAWSAAAVPTPAVVRALSGLCLTALRRVPDRGPCLPGVALATVQSLGAMTTELAVGRLVYLRSAVTFRPTLNAIEIELDRAAGPLKRGRDDLEEVGVPDCGFGPGGVRFEAVGPARVEQRVVAERVVTTWLGDGDPRAEVAPPRLSPADAAVLADLQGSAADATATLAAQRGRLDGLMGAPRTWPVADWRVRYLDHPLVGTLARRLIWTVDGAAVLFDADGSARDVAGERIEVGAEVGLWHPANRPVAEVVAWRQRLEQLEVTQPFKQAHREVYLLTDAERSTRAYSNRFAGHLVHQHRFNDVVAARGWRHQPRLRVGDDARQPPRKVLPGHGLRAEFWVEGTDDPDDAPARTYRWLATDQVRFYRVEAAANSSHGRTGGYASHAEGPGTGGVNEPVPLERVPPLALSEVLRDVDLFVGVASVGNDPTWQDGGPGGRYRTYWHDYSFGDLSATAQTRRDVLTRLVPRLKIADRCSFADRFLVVRGQRRTYKIHLGSGNILMEPNDQYLCIVPDRSTGHAAGRGDVYLPFEGDGTLSVILSKAFLLAADDRITDPTIVRQIGGR